MHRSPGGQRAASRSVGVRAQLGRATLLLIAAAAAGVVVAGVLTGAGAPSGLTFAASAATLATLAALVAEGTDQLGRRFGPTTTGVLQSALGNLPELFISIFALRAGLVSVVQAALVGSILGNSLLVLGLALFVGGVRHGTQHFATETPRLIAVVAFVSVGALLIPTVAHGLNAPAAGHQQAFDLIVAVVLLVVFVGSVVATLQGALPAVERDPGARPAWSTGLAVAVLGGTAAAAALVSDWFVGALQPAAHALGISQAFTGLVVVALAGNAVENVVAIKLAARDDVDTALSVTLNSSLQISLGLIPMLVLLSLLLGGPHLTLVLAPLLVVALALTAVVNAVVVFDGESNWVEGLALMALYAIIVVAFWWG